MIGMVGWCMMVNRQADLIALSHGIRYELYGKSIDEQLLLFTFKWGMGYGLELVVYCMNCNMSCVLAYLKF